VSGWRENGTPNVTIAFLQAPTIGGRRRRRVDLGVVAAFLAGFAVAMLLVALAR